MSVPRIINTSDYQSNQQLNQFLVTILMQVGFDSEDQEVFLAYLFAGGKPEVAAIAAKFNSTEPIVEDHMKKLYDQISSHPLAQNIFSLQQHMHSLGIWERTKD